jgi:hypothetical protein
MGKIFVRRRDKDLKQDEQPEPRKSVHSLLEEFRADEKEKELREAAAERADALDALGQQLQGAITPRDLERKLGGEQRSLIDQFFSSDDEMGE